MKSFSRIIIIYNPISTGDSKSAAVALQRDLKDRGVKNVVLTPTQYEDHAEELAYDYALKYGSPLIISSSGDGGYHEVVNGLMRATQAGATPCAAVLPAGNANDHHESTAKHNIVDTIVAGHIRPIDVLELCINDRLRWGHSYIGIGLTPAVAAELNEHSLHPLKEIAIVLRHIMTLKPIKIETEGVVRKLDSLVVTNIGRMAKVLRFNDATPNDGLCEITYFAHHTKLTLLWHLLRATLFGLDPDKQVEKFAFTTQAAMQMQIDGELIPLEKNARVEITVKKHALRVVQ